MLPRGEKTGMESVRIHWLHETESDSNEFALSTLRPWHKPEDIGVINVLDTPRMQMHTHLQQFALLET